MRSDDDDLRAAPDSSSRAPFVFQRPEGRASPRPRPPLPGRPADPGLSLTSTPRSREPTCHRPPPNPAATPRKTPPRARWCPRRPSPRRAARRRTTPVSPPASSKNSASSAGCSSAPPRRTPSSSPPPPSDVSAATPPCAGTSREALEPKRALEGAQVVAAVAPRRAARFHHVGGRRRGGHLREAVRHRAGSTGAQRAGDAPRKREHARTRGEHSVSCVHAGARDVAG